MFRKFFPVPVSFNMFSTFSIWFSISGLMLKSFMYLELSSVHSERQGSSFTFLHVTIQCGQHHLLNMLSLLQCILFCKKSGGCKSMDLNVGPQFYFTDQCVGFYYYSSVVQFGIKSWYCLHQFFCYQNYLTVLSFLVYPYEILYYFFQLLWRRVLEFLWIFY